jgi:hypothetical protein
MANLQAQLAQAQQVQTQAASDCGLTNFVSNGTQHVHLGAFFIGLAT